MVCSGFLFSFVFFNQSILSPEVCKLYVNMKPIITIIIDSRRPKKSGKYPIKLRITFSREQKYYPLGFDLSLEEFEIIQSNTNIKKIPSPGLRRQYSDYKLKVDQAIVKANQIIDKLPDFSFKLFEKSLNQNQRTNETVYDYYLDTIDQLRKDGRVGTADNYQSSMNSLKGFSPKLNLIDVSMEFLKSYEQWLLTKGKSISTVGIYLRPLRAIMNTAISQGMISRDAHYPFGKSKYQIPSSKNTKKALTIDEVGKLYNYKAPRGTWLEKARDFFIFSYLANGMNIKDIALLKFKNIDGEYLRFTRAKTINTNRTLSSQITVFIVPELEAIMNRWKNSDSEPDAFIFPILKNNLSFLEQQGLIRQFTKMINKYIKRIGHELGINKHITTYYARHSFATILKRSGVGTEIISESLGHSSLKTTSSYLDSFEDETKKQIAFTLINFKDI